MLLLPLALAFISQSSTLCHLICNTSFSLKLRKTFFYKRSCIIFFHAGALTGTACQSSASSTHLEHLQLVMLHRLKSHVQFAASKWGPNELLLRPVIWLPTVWLICGAFKQATWFWGEMQEKMNIKWNMDCATVELCSTLMMLKVLHEHTHSHTLLLGFTSCPRTLPHESRSRDSNRRPCIHWTTRSTNGSDCSFSLLWIWIESSCRMRDANISCGYFKQLKWSSFFFLFFRFWFLYFHQSRSRKVHKMAMICYWPESIIFFQRWVFQINCKHILQFVLRWDVAFPRTHMTMRVVGLWLVLLLLLLFLLLQLLRVVGGGSGWQLQKSSYFLFCLMIPDVDPSSLQLTPLHYLVFIRLCKATLQSDSACYLRVQEMQDHR